MKIKIELLEFQNELLHELEQQCPELQIKKSMTIVRQGSTMPGLQVQEPGNENTITYSLENYYDEYLHGKTLNYLAQEIHLDFYSKAKPEYLFANMIMDFEKVSPYICYKLVNPLYNKRECRNRPREKFLDLVKVYEIDVSEIFGRESYCNVAIRNDLLEYWNCTVDELKQIAEENTPRIRRIDIKPLDKMLQSFGRVEPTLKSRKKKANKLYVMSNRRGIEGASCMAYPEIVDVISKIVGDEYYIIPSSIHEVLILSTGENAITVEEMEALVNEVNRTHVNMEERLNDHIYGQDKVRRKIVPIYAQNGKEEQGIEEEKFKQQTRSRKKRC